MEWMKESVFQTIKNVTVFLLSYKIILDPASRHFSLSQMENNCILKLVLASDCHVLF